MSLLSHQQNLPHGMGQRHFHLSTFLRCIVVPTDDLEAKVCPYSCSTWLDLHQKYDCDVRCEKYDQQIVCKHPTSRIDKTRNDVGHSLNEEKHC